MDHEMDTLMKKLQKIQEEIGGDVKSEKSKSTKGDPFMTTKNKIVEDVHATNKILAELYDDPKAKKKLHPRETIKLQQTIRDNIRQLDQDWKVLKDWLEKEMSKKKSKYSSDELELRQQIVEQYASQITTMKERMSSGYAKRSSHTTSRHTFSSSSSTNAMTTEDFSRLTDCGPRPNRDYDLSQDNKDVLLSIGETDKKFDDILDEIGEGVQELGDLAKGINEEIMKQNIMLDGLDDRIDSTQQKVGNINSKMKETLGELGRGADKCMMDFICLVILLGVLAVLYNILIKKE